MSRLRKIAITIIIHNNYNELNTSQSYLRMVLNWHEHFFGNGDGRAVWFRQHQWFLLHAVHFEQAGPNFGYFCGQKLNSIGLYTVS